MKNAHSDKYLDNTTKTVYGKIVTRFYSNKLTQNLLPNSERGLQIIKQYFDSSIQKIDHTIKGEPFISEWSNRMISISHTRHVFAIYVSDETHKVGVDIEVLNPKLSTIKRRFLNETELYWITKVEDMHWAWCAKEAIFKLFGGEFENYFEEIEITMITKSLSIEANTIYGNVKCQGEFLRDELFLVYCEK